MPYKYKHSSKIQNRKRKVPLIRFVLFALAAFYIGTIVLSRKRTPQSTSQNAAIIPSFESINYLEADKDSLLERCIQKISHIVMPGETFCGILSKFDISRNLSNEIYSSLKPLGFPALFPGDSVVLNKNSDGEFGTFSLLSRNKHWYTVALQDTLLRAEKRPLKISSYIYLINGTLETSISEAMQQYGVSDVITWKFADIFAWDINFFLDPRKGDRFQIVFEQKYAEGFYFGYGDILAARYITGDKVFSAFGLRDSSGLVSYFDENGKSIQKQFLKAPLKFSRISSSFTYKRKHPVLGIVRPHLGIDYAAPMGTPVQAAADGKVQYAGRKGDYGNLIIISHGGAYETYYGHLHSFGTRIRTGARVTQGQLIGAVGATGMATGPHLDYRMKRSAQFVNPSTVNLPSEKQIDENRFVEFTELRQYCLNGFDFRFSKSDGLHILEISKPDISEATINQTVKLHAKEN